MPPVRGLQLSVTVQGVPEAERAIQKRSGYPLRATAMKGLRTAGNVARPIIAAQAPVLTGQTRASVKVRTLSRELGVVVGPTIWRRHFEIRGTDRGIRANPWVDRGIAMAETPAKVTFDRVVLTEVNRR